MVVKEDPVKRLMEFHLAMCEWERRCESRFRDRRDGSLPYDDYVKQVLDDRAQICPRYCLPLAWDEDNHSFEMPSAYDPSRQTIVSCQELSSIETEIVVQKDEYSTHMKYLMRLTDGEWMIAERWCYLEGSFKKHPI